MAGIVFAKFTKPTHRGQTIVFSRNALISRRNGGLYLMVRFGDLRCPHLIGCRVSGHFLTRASTEEGEVVPYHLEAISFGASLEGAEDGLQPLWPLVMAHRIDASSPLYDLGPRDLQTKQFEIILSLEGTTPETGNTIQVTFGTLRATPLQVRTSYLPGEILWGQRFEHTTVAYDKEAAKYAVSYTTINAFQPDKTPRSSARAMEERRTQGLSRSPSSSSLLTLTVPGAGQF
jgi:potassium inwardly-rectifying channel subfamily J